MNEDDGAEQQAAGRRQRAGGRRQEAGGSGQPEASGAGWFSLSVRKKSHLEVGPTGLRPALAGG